MKSFCDTGILFYLIPLYCISRLLFGDEINDLVFQEPDRIEKKKKQTLGGPYICKINRTGLSESPCHSYDHHVGEERGIEADNDSNASEDREELESKDPESVLKFSLLARRRHSCACAHKQSRVVDDVCQDVDAMAVWRLNKRICAGHDADVEESDAESSDQDDWEAMCPKFSNHLQPDCHKIVMRKRSLSLSPDFCFSVKHSNKSNNGFYAPPDEVLQRFKEAKLRGVPDPEVFAAFSATVQDILSDPTSVKVCKT